MDGEKKEGGREKRALGIKKYIYIKEVRLAYSIKRKEYKVDFFFFFFM